MAIVACDPLDVCDRMHTVRVRVCAHLRGACASMQGTMVEKFDFDRHSACALLLLGVQDRAPDDRQFLTHRHDRHLYRRTSFRITCYQCISHIFALAEIACQRWQ